MIRLIPIDAAGRPAEELGTLPEMAEQTCTAMAAFYQQVGFRPPWLGHLAVSDAGVVGVCGFKGPPAAGAVEVGYGTMPDHEGRGVATAMARELIAIARRADPRIEVFAQTLPQTNASNAILKKLGFRFAGTVDHPEDGQVWEWRLPPEG